MSPYLKRLLLPEMNETARLVVNFIKSVASTLDAWDFAWSRWKHWKMSIKLREQHWAVLEAPAPSELTTLR